MDKNIEGDDHLDYLDETLEQRRNFRVVCSPDTFACLNKRVSTVDEEFDCLSARTGRTGLQ